MNPNFSSRPNLEQLRKQSKSLLSQLEAGEASAADAFIEFLPVAKALNRSQARQAGFRLADAQSVIARRAGFPSWAQLRRHVEQLRGLEGTWKFHSLEIDGNPLPAGSLSRSRILMDGDRFRTESPEGNYEGSFAIDAEAEPHRLDIHFTEGPEAGNWSYGIYEIDGDDLKICLGLTGSPRPSAFGTAQGDGAALEFLRRSSHSRPEGVTGGQPETAPEDTIPVDDSEFEFTSTPLMQRLAGEWQALEITIDGSALPGALVSTGSRSTLGNEIMVSVGGQVMIHARMRAVNGQFPIAVDYLNLDGNIKGRVSLGILEWADGELISCIAPPGSQRPEDFTSTPGSHRTLSRWRPAASPRSSP